MRVTKMHGLANDFIVVDADAQVDAATAAALCDRRTGIGGDGLLRVIPTEAGVRMEYWNADGSTAEMCGNGLRCVARYAVDRGIVSTSEFTVETLAGPLRVEVGEQVVTTEIGRPELGETIEIDGGSYLSVSVGNPHAVRHVADVSAIDVGAIGLSVNRHPAFPFGVNVEFVQEIGERAVRMRVWERGVGETMACGTGMVAVAAQVLAGSGNGHHSAELPAGEVEVAVPGGVGQVRIDGDGTAWLSGPAVTVFEATLEDRPSG